MNDDILNYFKHLRNKLTISISLKVIGSNFPTDNSQHVESFKNIYLLAFDTFCGSLSVFNTKESRFFFI